jgi:hypothetical protein
LDGDNENDELFSYNPDRLQIHKQAHSISDFKKEGARVMLA